MFQVLKNLISFRPKVCDHTQNYDVIQYYNNDGTPMVYFRCDDCSYIDKGHVHGPGRGEKDSETWEGKLVIRGGRQIWPPKEMKSGE